MSTPDELTVLIQNLQKCNNTSESINFDLARTIQEFLNCLDKNVLEELEGGIHESEREKENDKERDRDVTNSFTSAAIFVENCVKIFGLKIEHLHNLAHNTLYNIYKENRHTNSGKKHNVMCDEEEYLFINEVKNLKSCPGDNEPCMEDDLLIKTIPLPTFLFSENVKKKEGFVEMRPDMSTVTGTGTHMDVHLDVIKEVATDLSLSHGNADGRGGDDRKANSKMLKQQEEASNETIEASLTTSAWREGENDRLTDEAEEVLEQNSIKPLNFDKMYLENDGILLLDINDYNIFINDQYDFSILNQNSSMLFEKYDFSCSRHSTYLSPTNLRKYMEKEKTVNDIYKTYNFNDLLNDDLCPHMFLFKNDFFDYDLALGIIKSKKYLLNRFKEQKKYLYVLDENSHMDKDKMGTATIEKNEIKRKLPHYYMLNCQNIKHAEDFFTYMQPSQIIDIISRNAERRYSSFHPSGDTSQWGGNGITAATVTGPLGGTPSPSRSNDQKLFEQIKIPDIYIQKLGLNFDYYHLDPLIYNLIKELKKKKNVEKYFSLNLFDEKNNYDFDILQDEEYVDDQNEENAAAEGESNLCTEKFLDVRSLHGGMMDGMMDDIPLEVFEKKDSSDAFFASFDEDIHDRVNKWNVFLEEKLQLLRSHPKYDVDLYKKNIIHYTINSGEQIPLSNLIKHKEPYQVCRNFLTTLMLINTDVLQISQINLHSESNDVSNYQINVKRENVQEYLGSSQKIKNASFVLKDKKRKTASKGDTSHTKPAKKKPPRISSHCDGGVSPGEEQLAPP
ncbi:hypothetical protein AK88_01338 [Plasmodium fragile]|uniref:Condensin-2 complex subunit H2 C-terminal domain-containing protein n=1 Tax=Plasmodium fragile TaxID=5857 RepID=A0A0D9QPL0_PLAFR|nr:uncharacterized protein AK88_01338 [Plasmodium fragile]KJP89045.1 hypothetical protein AK88_01338 [Plasmodium fragile]